ncbi:MAG: hypothetical protein JWP89_4108 [Schlesneria sp.]|nr:hypothetical protein [Schlesneria sp.]
MKEFFKGWRRKIECGLLVLACGCDQSPPQLNVPTTSVVAPPRDVESILPGDRPTSIDGAKLYKAADILESPEILRSRTLDQWICIEGIVGQSGEIMGASFVQIRAEDHKEWIHCEGGGLWNLRLTPGQNVIVRGRVSHSSRVGDCAIVTQAQITDAIAKETETAKESTSLQ